MRRYLTSIALFALVSGLTAQVPNYVPTNGLVGWWPFSGNANDESGNGNNGIVNGAALSADRFGNQDQCYSFNGVDNYILILNSLLPSNETSYSISLWVNSNTFISNYSELMCDRGNVTYAHKYRISMADNGASQQPGTFYCLMGDGFGETHCYDTTFLNLNTWIHYIVVFNASTNEMEGYKNGALVDNNLSTGVGSGYPNQSTSTYIGQSISPDGFDFGFHGLIDDVGIWDRVLDSCEIQALFNAGSLGVSPTAVSFSGLNSSYTVADAPVTLVGTPAGGVFIGPGVSGNTFDPASAGVGQHSIIYSYVDDCGSVNSAGLCTEVTLNVGVGGSHMSTSGVHVYPNPNSGQFTVEMELQGLVSLQVFDAGGRLAHNEVFQTNGRRTIRNLDLAGLAKGHYTVQVQNNGATVSQSVVIE